MPELTRAVLTEPRSLQLQRVAAGCPAEGQLLVRSEAVGICGTDLELLEGTMTYLVSGFATYPLVPGHEWCGTVVAVGPGTEGFAVGDRVVGECSIGCGGCERCLVGDYHLCPDRCETGIAGQGGALAEQFLFPARAAHVVPVHVEVVDAVLVEPLAVSYRGVRRTGARAGDRLVVVGAGTIGLLSALAAEALGIHTVLVELDPARVEFASTLGLEAHGPVTRAPGESSGVAALEGSAFVIDASGSGAGRRAAVDLCAAGGTVVLLGLMGSVSEQDFDDIVVRDLTVRGSLGSPGVWREVIELVASGEIRPSRVVSHEFDLQEAGRAFEMAASGLPGVRKILVRPTRAEV